MSLSNELISKFVKITNDNTKPKEETTVYGTTVEYNGSIYVKLDGSELLTPVIMAANAKPDERVMVVIKNHTATITGNLSSPAARLLDVSEIDADTITELEILIAEKVDTKDFNAEVARIDELRSDNVTIKQRLSASEADISDLDAKNANVSQRLTANEADISSLKTTKLDASVAELEYAKAEELEATNADIHNLEATYGDFASLTADKFTAVDTTIKNLNTSYANIDFSNIGTAAIQHFFATSGLIEDVVVGDGTVTGHLVGVTISGDLIEGNTVKAEKLVIKGTDGLYYKLNTDGMVTEAEQTDQNSLNGSIIQAKSITASKISVTDLVAFGATIGGFHITDDSIYSGAKASVDNTTRGIYLDNDGQIAFGDSGNFVKFFKDTDGTYKLTISANSILFGANNDNIEQAFEDVHTEVGGVSSALENTQTQVSSAESLIEALSESISMLVTDGSGASLMTQTENGWTFNTAEMQDLVNRTSEGLNDLTHDLGDVNNTVDILRQAVDDLGIIAEYVKIGTYEDEPCIELGEADSDFKLLITNTRILFMEGTGVPAYFTNQSMHIKKAVIEEELQQGGFMWKIRSNGNLGLVWKGVTS